MRQVKYDPVYKYIQCECEKKQIIQLGWELLLYIHPLMLVVFIGFSLLSLMDFLKGQIEWRFLFLPGFTVLLLFVFWADYKKCFREMRQAGHTTACSKKIAWKVAWRESLYSHYEIDVEVIKMPSRQLYRVAGIATVVWMVTIVASFFFITGYNYEDATSIVYPILFIFSIVASALLLTRLKFRYIWLTVICILNIVSSSVMLSLYVLR